MNQIKILLHTNFFQLQKNLSNLLNLKKTRTDFRHLTLYPTAYSKEKETA